MPSIFVSLALVTQARFFTCSFATDLYNLDLVAAMIEKTSVNFVYLKKALVINS